MRVALVFESMFGNTESLARDVAAGLAAAGAAIELVNVAATSALLPEGCDLLVLAAPTHALTLSRPATRADAVSQGASPERAATGLREWLAAWESSPTSSSRRPRVAVFDTRMGKVRRFPGSAARSVARNLEKSGFDVVDRISFYVEDVTGPLVPGERERAWQWGLSLVAPVPVPSR